MYREDMNRPLAYGYIEDGELIKILKWPFTNELSVGTIVGGDLVNFVWFDLEMLQTMLRKMFDIYLQAREKKNDYNFIALSVLAYADQHHFLAPNSYIAIYLLSYLDLLLDESIDQRVFAGVEGQHLLYQLSLQDGSALLDSAKLNMIDEILTLIAERQEKVAETLKKVLENPLSEGEDPTQHYYKMEQNDEAFRHFWHSEFTTRLGKTAEHPDDVLPLTVLDTIDDILRYELVQTLIQKAPYKLCQCCGQLFIPTGRVDSLYCDRIMPGQDQPCRKIGANLVAKQKVQKDPVLKLYRQAYQRLNKRVEYGYMEPEGFQKWRQQAESMRDRCQAREISFDEFITWIDKTSRQQK